jgi:branched-chain amino acid transport system substrate-binding protein
MRLQYQWWSGLVAAMLGGLVGVTAVAAGGEQFLPVLSIREGAQRSLMIPRADGYIAYLTLLNARDGGINGVPLVWEECAMGTPPTYVLTELATHDQIPLITLGYGRADAADGQVFPYVFNPPTSYWSQNTAKIRFIGQQAGGMEKLRGLKIAHVYRDDGYGRETIPILDIQAAQYGFVMQHLAVPPPGLDQKATWLRVKVAQPDWVILRTGGLDTSTALKEAVQVGFPRDKIVGAAPTCAEQDMVPAGEAARGFICVSLFATGRNFPLIQDVLKYVYAQGKGPGPESDVGTVYWIRGIMHGVLTAEGIRTAMRHFGHQPLSGAQVQWGLDHLNITVPYIKEIGAEGLMPPVTLSCRDHEGGASVKFQQWDGAKWTVITDWVMPDQALVRPLVEAAAAKYAQDKGITPRACP